MILYDVYIVQNVWQVHWMWCVWQMSISMYLRHCVYVDVYEMRMRCGEQTKWSSVFNIVSAYIHLQYVKLCEINIRTRMNEGTTDRLDRQRYIIFDVFHRKFDVWKNGWDGFMHSAQLLAEKLPANTKWNEQREAKRTTSRLHACTHMTISRQTLLFLLPLLIFIAFCLFVFGSLSCSLARMQFVRVCMRPFDAVRLLQRC